ncbi:hypothetical protein GCK72_004136 [Caenorhabditis remanei]|uniref:RBR-type E3 ubiquitin transferase n=1 Tax=Caenorhabditis remanei TaxID=31234 RepID=A0A6A5HAU5_CAERE|nr:hypothetical protein GCK72_004136 [Caenorhabditis remanei]KAF1764189.1 hypothetical protein GCK72_004136 [Caenorhabditis remanei]
MDSDDDIQLNDSDSDGESEEKGTQILSFADLETKMKDAISEIQDILEVKPGVCRILLQKHKWDKNSLLERFYEHPDTNEFLKAANVIPEESETFPELPVPTDCDICCMPGELTGLACGHLACIDCWRAYISDRINDGKCEVECMTGECMLLMEDEKVNFYITDPIILEKRRQLIVNSYVEINKCLRWCPGKNCGKIIKAAHSEPHLVQCSCGTQFCFFCGNDGHEPVSCRLLKLWEKKCLDDSETANWISVHTKDCPKCLAPIEKISGCNRMLCRNPSCKFQFCWMCMRDWDVHGYSPCNSYDPKKEKDRVKNRANLDRYLFYYNRYKGHGDSLKLEKKLVKAVETKMEVLQHHSQISWADVQYLPKAVETLSTCRRTMMNTYIFAFYLEHNNHAEMFEANQRDLEMATEQLSGFLEQDLLSQSGQEKMKTLIQNVQDKCRYVEHRRKILMDHVVEGTEHDVWVFREE